MDRADDLSCAELVELVTEYLEDALPTRERNRLEAHLTECEGCVNYVDQMRRTIELTGRLREDDLPQGAEEALLAAFHGWLADSPG
jgi:anti-sigma factor RsiW